jgi:hypothetical protein
MKNVFASAAEAGVLACSLNTQDACMIRNTLADVGHPHPPTPIQTDNQCAQGILTNTVRQKGSKANDMQFYWRNDCISQKQIHVHWVPGLLYQASLPCTSSNYTTNVPSHNLLIGEGMLIMLQPNVYNQYPVLYITYVQSVLDITYVQTVLHKWHVQSILGITQQLQTVLHKTLVQSVLDSRQLRQHNRNTYRVDKLTIL